MAAGTLNPGDQLWLWGGYDQEPAWLCGGEGYHATFSHFIPGQYSAAAAVAELDQPISVSGVRGSFLVLTLRHVGAEWGDRVAVHVELCDFEPETKPWATRRHGEWVECGAICEVARRGSAANKRIERTP